MITANLRKGVVIVAGGSGSRMGGDTPKQFISINGVPVLMHTIQKFLQFDPSILVVLVLPENQLAYWAKLCQKGRFDIPHQIAAGGQTRFHSVQNGLALTGQCDLIAIHDGVRPLVSTDTIARTFDAALQHGSAIPVLPANESLRQGTPEHSSAVDRSQYFMVQTPQVFRREILIESYRQPYDPAFTDDASVVEKAGRPVRMVPGNRENIKITHPEDLQIAALWL